MYCVKCGKEIRDGIDHCPYCGANLKEANTQQEDVQQGDAQQANTRQGVSEPAPKKKRNKIVPVIAVLAVLLIAVAIFLLVGRRVSFRPVDYVTMQVQGVNKEGTASLSFDADRLVADIAAKKQLTEGEKEQIRFLLSSAGQDFVLSAKPATLSNGDIVNVVSNMDKNLLKEYGVTLKNGSVKLEVEGLIEAQEISLNDYISVGFSGFEGYGYAYMSTDWDGLRSAMEERVRNIAEPAEAERFIEEELDSDLYSVSGTIWPRDGLKTGDEVSLSIQTEQSGISQYGIRFVWDDISIAVDGLLPTETVQVTDYLQCEFSGYDGAGEAWLSLDTQKLASDLQECFEGDRRGAYGAFEEGSDIAVEAENAANIISDNWDHLFVNEFSQESGLSNGDKVTVESYNENAEDEEDQETYLTGIGVYMKGGKKEFTAENLEEPQEIDLADAMTVELTGVCPNVEAKVTIDHDLPYVWLTSLESLEGWQSLDVANGDVVSGEITYDEQEMLEAGYRVTNSTYSYTVSGLPTYRLTCDALEDPSVAAIGAAAEPAYRAKLRDNSEEIIRAKSGGDGWIVWNESRLQPMALRTVFLEDESDAGNRLYLMYQAALPIRCLDRTMVQGDVYFVLRMDDVEELEDGTLSYEEPDFYWSSGLYLTLEEAWAYMDGDIADLENAEVLAEATAEGSLTVELEDEPEIHGEEEIPAAPKAGEIAEAAKSQAAMVITYEGHTYARYDIELTWQLARTFCETAGGHLMTETSDLEKVILTKLMEDAPYGNYWLGASDDNWEGDWEWVTGEPFEWTDWESGQPDNDASNDVTGEDYLEAWHGGSWNDIYSEDDTGRGFILELEPTSASSGEATWLNDLEPLENYSCGVQDHLQDPYGNDHYRSLYLDASERGMAVYDLNGEYSRFTGTLSTWAEADSGCLFECAVWGDGKLLFSEYSYQKSDAPIPFSLNVEGIRTLSIQSRNRGTSDGGFLFLNEAKLISYGTEEGMAAPLERDLDDAGIIDAVHYEDRSTAGVLADAYGVIHEDTYAIGADGSALWNLNGEYTALTGLFYTGIDAYDAGTSANLKVLLDGEEVLSKDHFDIYSGYLPLELDLTGKSTLEIRVDGNGEYSEAVVYLTDTTLVRADAGEDVSEAPRPEFPEVQREIARRASGILTCGDSRYYLFEQPISWAQAKSFCESAGGMLACPTNDSKTAALTELLGRGVSDDYWIGGSLEGTDWLWVDSEQIGEYQNWNEGSPGGEDQAETRMCIDRDGFWDDRAEDEPLGFIMEVTAETGRIPEMGADLGFMEWLDGSGCETTGMFWSEREDGIARTSMYPGCVRMDVNGGAWFSVALNGGYSTLFGDILASDATANSSVRLAVFGDGKQLYERKGIHNKDELYSFDVDLTGVDRLTVAVANDRGSENGFLYFNGLAQAAETPDSAGIDRLSDLVMVDASEHDTGSGLFVDAYGVSHDGYLAMNAGRDSRMLFNLSGQYSVFSGVLAPGAGTDRNAQANVVIKADGETVYESGTFSLEGGSVPFELDITGKGTLEIVTEADVDDTWIYVEDDRLF